MRRAKSLRIGVHIANAVVWEPVYRTRLSILLPEANLHRARAGAVAPHLLAGACFRGLNAQHRGVTSRLRDDAHARRVPGRVVREEVRERHDGGERAPRVVPFERRCDGRSVSRGAGRSMIGQRMSTWRDNGDTIGILHVAKRAVVVKTRGPIGAHQPSRSTRRRRRCAPTPSSS